MSVASGLKPSIHTFFASVLELDDLICIKALDELITQTCNDNDGKSATLIAMRTRKHRWKWMKGDRLGQLGTKSQPRAG